MISDHATKSKAWNHGYLQMVPSIAHAFCFVDGAVANRLVDFDCLEERLEFGLAGMSTPKMSKERAVV